jgi:hypothetical protein
MRKVWLGVVCLLALIGTVHGAGLRTTFVKVTLENLKIGNTYNIREMANLPLALYNTGDAAIDLAVEATVPIKGELRDGYEPIPDAAWIVVGQDTFWQVEPGEVAMTDVLISIPDADDHLGKRYQAMIWSHTFGQGMIAYGLKSEVLFTISRHRDGATKAIYLLPTEMYISDVEIGRVVDVGKMGSGVTLKVFNPSDEDKQVEIESISPGTSPLLLTDGYLECPNPRFLILSEQMFILPKHEDKEMKVYLAFPRGQEYIGNRYAFVIRAKVGEEAGPTLYSKIYVSLRE